MNTRERALRQLVQLTETYANPNSAYVARSRLKRLLLSALQLAAEEAGADGPLLPGPFQLPKNAPVTSKEIVGACNAAWTSAETLCQPSEALEVRWTEGWRHVMQQVAKLEMCIRADSG